MLGQQPLWSQSWPCFEQEAGLKTSWGPFLLIFPPPPCHTQPQVSPYVLHFLGREYPSRPGRTAMLLMVFLQLRHWMAILVALARTGVAAITIPGIFTRWDIWSDCKGKGEGEVRKTLGRWIGKSRCHKNIFFLDTLPTFMGL